ncbi:hypothetical protein [Salinispora arenicola]|uniref:hypothetical protein n=1 Tax=Salinispora arenicola TaxID=168697 RepID=UPI0003AA1E3D|nr:hypothetical protein [Salinispora arenicola]
MIDSEAVFIGAEAARRLAEQRRVELEPGLTAAEFDRIEGRFGFEFADDHRAFLSAGLPIGRGWPDWCDGEVDHLRDRLAWPVKGVLFDVEHNAFWHDEWDARPADRGEALVVAGERLASVPQMIPVYSHRYLPAGRGTFGHPVLSMYQTDIIFYGVDLMDYVRQEFGAGESRDRRDPRWQPHATVAFWRELVG